MADPTTNITLGYGGGAKIDGAQVLLTGGSLTKALSVPKIAPFGMPYTSATRAEVPIGYGTMAYTGSVSFDFTLSAVTNLITTTFLARNHTFDVILSDGNKTYTASNCKMSSFSISSSPNALVTGSLDFMCCSDFTEAGSMSNIFDQNTNLLVKYWNTGGTGVESFTLTFTQQLTPMYLNYSSGTDAQRKEAQYIRGGVFDVTLDVSAFTDWLSVKAVNVGSKLISITQGMTENYSFNFNGVNDTGSHSYTYKSNALADSSASFFTIT